MFLYFISVYLSNVLIGEPCEDREGGNPCVIQGGGLVVGPLRPLSMPQSQSDRKYVGRPDPTPAARVSGPRKQSFILPSVNYPVSKLRVGWDLVRLVPGPQGGLKVMRGGAWADWGPGGAAWAWGPSNGPSRPGTVWSWRKRGSSGGNGA